MGQGWKIGENEIGQVIEQLGEGNLVPQNPLQLGKIVPLQPDVKQLQADIDAIKKKLGM